MSDRISCWSCGGGTQSAAIAALIVQGRLPKPDLAVMVDTGRERTSTWEYLHGTLMPALESVGVRLTVIGQELAHWGVTKGDTPETRAILLPMFTTQSGEVSKLPGYCSNEWKRRPMMRWLRSQGVESCEVWLGISTDEMRRVRQSREGWFQHRYPLIFDVPMRRSDCVQLVASMGWPEPPRSSCWMCPNMGDREWQAIRRDHPDDFAAAVELERSIREGDPDLYLHKSAKPLDSVDFDAQPDLPLGGCDSGFCFV